MTDFRLETEKRNKPDPKNIRERPKKMVTFKSMRTLPSLGTVGRYKYMQKLTNP